MIYLVLENLLTFFNFILVFSLVTIILLILLSTIFKKFNIKYIKLYGFFLELSDVQILSCSCTIIKFLFIFWCVFDRTNIGIIHLVFLILITLIECVGKFNVLNFIFELFNSVLEFLALMCSNLLFGYIKDVRFDKFVFIIAILLSIFIIIYCLYFMLKNLNMIVIKNKYIKRRNNV